jgi:putative glutathione S-transferase
LEQRLEKSEFLLGDAITEADWRLLTTAIRFDPVYVVHFKCSRRLYAEYPNLQRHMMRLIEEPGVRETTHLDHIRHHYFRSHLHINPRGLIPVGPKAAWEN